ncbi:MAG: hypothetical protein DCC52_18520 [Chloroflexi bacterium]|nr:MAG: hypothetical protein DCC52_18520 [Chloroflexota bacterium]
MTHASTTGGALTPILSASIISVSVGAKSAGITNETEVISDETGEPTWSAALAIGSDASGISSGRSALCSSVSARTSADCSDASGISSGCGALGSSGSAKT